MSRRHTRRTIRAAHEIAGAEAIGAVRLWEFPEADFAAWRELVVDPSPRSYAAYLSLLAAVEADQERAGRRVVRVQFSVARMREELARRGWPNTPDRRAAVIGLLALSPEP
jgi:hypothetical protein